MGISEGTKSYLCGCHQFLLHPLFVTIAWKKVYGKYPQLWEFICILLHDIGICGREYLSKYGTKEGHWEMGAKLAGWLFGMKGAWLCAGHTPESNMPRSKLFLADKYSWIVAPMCWLWLNYYIEGFNGAKVSNPVEWKKIIAKNLKMDYHFSSHELYEDEIYRIDKR